MYDTPAERIVREQVRVYAVLESDAPVELAIPVESVPTVRAAARKRVRSSAVRYFRPR